MRIKKAVFTHVTTRTLASVLTAVLIFSVAVPATALAGPYKRDAVAFKQVPAGSRHVKHNRINYVYHKGRFYRPGKAGYVYVRPPAGIVVKSLPAAAAAVIVSGITYHVYDTVYYQRVPAGYKVVTVPVKTVPARVETIPARHIPPALPGEQVRISVQALNVRSGPGLEHGILAQVYQGSTFEARGTAPDWIYIVLPDGRYGWVMEKYVTRTGVGPLG